VLYSTLMSLLYTFCQSLIVSGGFERSIGNIAIPQIIVITIVERKKTQQYLKAFSLNAIL